MYGHEIVAVMIQHAFSFGGADRFGAALDSGSGALDLYGFKHYQDLIFKELRRPQRLPKCAAGKNDVYVCARHRSRGIVQTANCLSGCGYVPGEAGGVWQLRRLLEHLGLALPVQPAVWRHLPLPASLETQAADGNGPEGGKSAGMV